MARSFAAASTQYLLIESDLGFASVEYPLTLACWFKANDTSHLYYVMQLVDKSAPGTHWDLTLRGADAGDPIQAYCYGPSVKAETSTGFTAGTWHHGCAVFADADHQAVYLDGGGKGTNTGSSIAMSDTDRFAIGGALDSTPNYYLDGLIAHAAVWHAALSDDDAAALAAGLSPLLVHPASLIAYFPLHASDTDQLGSYDLTPYNTPTWSADLPPIWTPSRQIVVPGAPAGGAALTKSLSDGLTLSDSHAKAFRMSRTDGFALGDAVGKGAAKVLADGLTVSDLVANAMAKAISDGIALSDVLAKSVQMARLDQVNLSDVPAKLVGKILADGAVISDSLQAARTILLSLADGLTLTDSLVKAYSLNYSDAVAVSDALAKSVAMLRSDGLSMADSLSYVRGLFLSLADGLTISDSLASELVSIAVLLLAGTLGRDLTMSGAFARDLTLSGRFSKDLTLTSTITGGGGA